MKTKMIAIVLITAVLEAFAVIANWNADSSKAEIGFSITGPFGLVNGSLKGLKTTIVFDENNLASSYMKASVNVGTMETGNSMRNHDLEDKSEWFDVVKFPLISFASKKIEKTDQGYKVSGDLTIKGVTKPVEIPFTFSQTGTTGNFKGQFTVKRKDFGVGGGNSVEDEVHITLNVPVSKS